MSEMRKLTDEEMFYERATEDFAEFLNLCGAKVAHETLSGKGDTLEAFLANVGWLIKDNFPELTAELMKMENSVIEE